MTIWFVSFSLVFIKVVLILSGLVLNMSSITWATIVFLTSFLASNGGAPLARLKICATSPATCMVGASPKRHESIKAAHGQLSGRPSESGRNIPDDFTTNQFCRYNIPAFLWLVPLLNLMKHRVNSYEPRAISIIGYVLPSYLKLIAKSHYIQSPLLQDRSHYPLCVLYKEGLCGIQIEP